MLSAETIQSNFERFRTLCDQVNLGSRSTNVLKMVDHLGERLAMCPGSAKVEFHNAFPGGLVEHSLRVLDFATEWHKGLKRTVTTKVTKGSLIVSCLFHDLGKVGDDEHDYYVPLSRENEWKRDKWGQRYDYNDKLSYMTVPLRGLWLLQRFGVVLTQEESLAVYLNDGQYIAENKPYAMREPDLAIIVHQADLLATRWEKAHHDPGSRG